MPTLAPATLLASPPDQVSATFLLTQGPPAGSDRAVRVLILAIVVVLVVLALRTVGRAVAPILQLAQSFVAVSLAAVLMLAALVLVVVVAVGSV